MMDMNTKIFALLLIILFFFAFGCSAPVTEEPDKTSNKTNETIQQRNETTQPNTITKTEDNKLNTSPESTVDFDKIREEVIPSKGINLGIKWRDIGPRTVKSGALNLTKFEIIMKRNGKTLTTEQMQILQNGSNDYIIIDHDNSLFVLDVFWAFGLVSKNPVLESSPMTENMDFIPRFASTGGWPVGNVGGGELFASKKLVTLTDAQQKIVEEVAANTYRPCCNNPTSFPDCNHGMAALGLAEWMAYQNATKEEIYEALLAANSYWFPQTYLETAVYFELQNKSWNDIDPKEILSANYSSATGYYNTKQKIKDVPQLSTISGSCGA